MPQTIDNMSVTWTNSLTTYTGIKLNAAGSSDANSAAGSLLMDLQVGGSSRFSVRKDGYTAIGGLLVGGASGIGAGYAGTGFLTIPSAGRIDFGNSGVNNPDVFLTRRGTANLRLGAADTTGTTAPTAQTLSVQSWTSSTNNNQPGANFTIAGSQGTGTGAGGSIIFQVAPAGAVSNGVQNALVDALTISSTRNITIGGAWNDFQFRVPSGGGSRVFTIVDGATSCFTTSVSGTFSVGSFGLGASIPSPDVILARDAANTLALRNGANAQTFNIYNTFTDTSNYERLRVDWATTAGRVTVGPQWAGTGTAKNLYLVVPSGGYVFAQTNGAISFGLDGTGSRWDINSSGHFLAGTDNTYDIGASGVNRPRNLFIASSVTVGQNIYAGTAGAIAFGSTRALLKAGSTDGVLTIMDSNQATFDRLQFGGTTSSFPALKRNSTALETKLADDSAYAPHAMQYLDVTDGITAPASATGRARIYVDTADGDLKVIFADGTVKTIVTDT